MARNEKLPRYSVARSAKNFYVYENFTLGHFGVLKQIAITDSNIAYISAIEEKVKKNDAESVITNASELNRVLKVLKNQTRHNRGNNALDPEKRANSNDGGVSFTEYESDGIGDSRQGTGNRRTVKYSLKDPISDEIERERNFKCFTIRLIILGINLLLTILRIDME
ncbi:MAG: hypothetical protein IKA05_04320 [Clostridia bacterium]|nr:hypothetical protein [Clostridia bacterium]